MRLVLARRVLIDAATDHQKVGRRRRHQDTSSRLKIKPSSPLEGW